MSSSYFQLSRGETEALLIATPGQLSKAGGFSPLKQIFRTDLKTPFMDRLLTKPPTEAHLPPNLRSFFPFLRIPLFLFPQSI